MASRTFFADINLEQNEIQFAVLHSLASAPNSGLEAPGQIYSNTASNQRFFWNGNSWISMSSSTASSVVFSGVLTGTNTGQTLTVGANSELLIGSGAFQFQGSSSGIMTLDTNLSGTVDRSINLPNISATSTILATSESPSTGEFAKQSSGADGTITFASIQNSDITGILSIDDITDVIITTPSNPSYLRFNGSNWVDVNIATVASDIGSTIDHGSLAGLADDDHPQYIFNSPNTSRTNIITPTNDQTPLILRGPTGSADVFAITNNGGGSEFFVIDSNSDIFFAGDQIFFNHNDGTNGGYILVTRSSTGLGGFIDLSTIGAGAGGRIIADTNGGQDAGFLNMRSNGDSRGGNIDLGAAIGVSLERSGQWTATAGVGGRGGDLIMDGSNEDAGDIDTSGGSANGKGGNIFTYGGFATSGTPILRGGNIQTFGSNSISGNTRGGDILTNSADGSGSRGGDIITQSGAGGQGGDIITSNGGGSINTNTGTIGLGTSGTRLTLQHSATADRTTTFINQTGSVPVFTSAPGSANLFALSDNALGGIKFATRSISDLSDVNTFGVSSNDLLRYNGSSWVPVDANTVGVTDHGDLAGLTDDDHIQYIINNPNTVSRNTIESTTNDVTSLTVVASSNSGVATFDIFAIEDDLNNSLFTIDDTSGSHFARFSSGLTEVVFSTPVRIINDSLILENGSSNSIGIQAPTTLTSYTLTLPQNDGANGQVLQTNGSGVTSWTSVLSSLDLDGLTDVVITSPTASSYLRYNGSNWIDVASSQILNDIESSIDHSSISGLTIGDDHTQYIIDVPGNSSRNVINPSANNIVSLIIEGAPDSGSATYNYFVIRDSSTQNLFTIGTDAGSQSAAFGSGLDSVTTDAPLTLNSVNISFVRTSQTINIAIPGSGVTGYTFTLPPNSGSNGEILKTNGSGVTDWGTLTLNNLSDVNTSGVANSNLLQFNGSNWVPVAANTVGVTAHANLTGLTTGDDHTQYIIDSPLSNARNRIDGDTGQRVLLHLAQGTGGTFGVGEGNTIFLIESNLQSNYFRANATSSDSLIFQMNAGSLQLHDETRLVFKTGSTNAADGVSLKANSTISSSYTITLPGSGPTASGNVLYNTGSGTLAWGSHNNMSGLTTGDPHTQYITKSPSSSARNLITASNATTIPLSIKGHASQSVDVFVVESNGGSSYLTIDSDGDALFSQDLTISGNLTVNGTTTTVNTTELVVEDNIIIVNSGQSPQNAGLEVDRGASPNASILYNETSDEWFIDNASVSLQIARKFVDSSTIVGNGVLDTFDIAHNMGTLDVIVSVYDSNDNQVEVEIVITNSNKVTTNFAKPISNGVTYKVVIIG